MGYIVYEYNRMKTFSIIYIKYTHMLRETLKGVLFSFAGKEAWLPKSMIAVDFKNKIIALPSTVAFRASILEYRTEPKQKVDESALKELQNRQNEKNTRPFRDKIGKTAV